MSRFSGPQGKGALRRHLDDRYRTAVRRQLLMQDRPLVAMRDRAKQPTFLPVMYSPAPVDEFLRPADTVESLGLTTPPPAAAPPCTCGAPAGFWFHRHDCPTVGRG